MDLILTSLILIALFSFLFHIIWYKPLKETNVRLKRTVNFYNETYLQKQGSTTMFGDKGFDNPVLNYDLRSWDGGKNWYVVDYNFKTEELKVLGEVETIHSGLFDHLESWRKLTEHVSKNGPLNPLNLKDVAVMENAGLTVNTK